MSDSGPIRTIPNDYSKYHSLDPLLREIRILRVVPIQPGSPPGEVACELFRTNLEDCPPFRALSYCWGDLEVTSPVDLTFCCSNKISFRDAAELGNDEGRQRRQQGQQRIQNFKVTANLHRLLRTLNFGEENSFIWADMLCINQGDPVERSAQVALMRDIYRRAASVLVWLGGEPGVDEGLLDEEDASLGPLFWSIQKRGYNSEGKIRWDRLFLEFRQSLFAPSPAREELLRELRVCKFLLRLQPPSKPPDLEGDKSQRAFWTSDWVIFHFILWVNLPWWVAGEAHSGPWRFLGDLAKGKVLYGAYKDSVFHTGSAVWRFVRYSLGTVLDHFEQAEDIAESIYHRQMVAMQRFHAHEEDMQNYRSNDFIKRSAKVGQNPWFKRVWVLQEVHSNPVVYVRHGAKQVSWLAFNSLYMASYDINTKLVQQSIFSKDWAMLETVWETIKRGVVPNLWTKIGLLADSSKENFEICKLLERTGCDFEATEPRDKLFGIYHLATDVDPTTFRPDYTKSLGETYQSFTEWLILQHGHLEVLSFVRNATPDKLAELPSWVPDFRVRIQGREWRLAEMCRNRSRVVPTLTAASKMFDGRYLRLRGRHLATVKNIVSLHDFQVSGLQDCSGWNDVGIDKLWVMLFLSRDITRRKARRGANSTTEEAVSEKFSLMAFLQTMLVTELDESAGMDDESFITGDSERIRDLIRIWGERDPRFRSLEDCPRDSMQYQQLHQRLIGPNAAVIATHDTYIDYMILNGRSFFFSADGRLGLCPEGTLGGDSVVMLDGGSTPFVIREDPRGYGTMREWLTHGKTWEFIGECYLQGAMAVAGCRDWGWHDPLREDYEIDSYKGPRVMDDGGIVVGSYPERVFRLW